MTERFIKFIPSEEAEYLQEHYPNAFLLLCLIAKRARRISGKPDGLEIGEAKIGDYKKAGIKTRGQYRHSLEILVNRAHIKITETNRTRQKATNGTTTEGTKVKLLKSDIWDINPEDSNHCNNHSTTTEQPLNNHEQERIRKNKKEKENTSFAQTPKSAFRKVDELKFSFEINSFVGINDLDRQNWNIAYPGINLEQEILRAQEWVLANPTKAKKKWRQFLTGWLGRASDRAINLAASKAQNQMTNQEKEWENINRQKFFDWFGRNKEVLKHMEYRNGAIYNKNNGKDLSLKLPPESFAEAFPNVAGVKRNA